MAFIVEDGTGVDAANSYASVSDADTYFAERELTAWADLTQDQKQAALINATEYIDVRWDQSFRMAGRKAHADQFLLYPRVAYCVHESLTPTEVPLPLNLVRATFQYALAAKDGPLAPVPTEETGGRQPSLVREKVGPIEEERRWSDTAVVSSSFRQYPIADALIRSILEATGRGRVFR